LPVLAATQPDDSCTHADQPIPLTRHQIRRLLAGLCQQLTAPRSSCTGPEGDAAVRPLPEPATTADAASYQHDYEVPLE